MDGAIPKNNFVNYLKSVDKVYNFEIPNHELANDFIIGPGGQAVDDEVPHPKDHHRAQTAQGKQGHIGQAQGGQDAHDHLKGRRQVDHRPDEGQEEHRPHLTADGRADLLAAHAHLLHDVEALLVLISLGNLFVIDDEDGGHQEEQPQKDAQEEQTAVCGIEALFLGRPGGCGVRDLLGLAGELGQLVIKIHHRLLICPVGKVHGELPVELSLAVVHLQLPLEEVFQGAIVGHHQDQLPVRVGRMGAGG